MSNIFSVVVYQPIYNLLIFIYNWLPVQDFGVAIILTTVILKLILIPLSKKQIESQKKLQEIQPQIKEIQQKHKNDKEKQSKELMEFYKKNKTNPFSGCLPLVVQIIFLFAIYRILFNISNSGLMVQGEILYSFVANPLHINQFFLGFIDMAKPNVVFAVLAAAAQFIQTKMLMSSQKKESKEKTVKPAGEMDFSQIMNKQMLYLGPAMTLFIGMKFAAGLSLYWLISTLFMIFQQMYLTKKK
jgi:YidC/Oxa1 family membrane protein insertase